jgi:hypothetical protein
MALEVQVLNVLGLVCTRGFGGYLIGHLWLLVGSGFFSVRLLAVCGLRPPPKCRAIWIALFPLMYPTACDTAYFGGIEISMCT